MLEYDRIDISDIFLIFDIFDISALTLISVKKHLADVVYVILIIF